jgi:hypothetical protein
LKYFTTKRNPGATVCRDLQKKVKGKFAPQAHPKIWLCLPLKFSKRGIFLEKNSMGYRSGILIRQLFRKNKYSAWIMPPLYCS